MSIRDYPLRESSADTLCARTGRPLGEIDLEAVRRGEVSIEDLSIHPDTLRAQAAIAEKAGFPQLATNLRRAAELALIPTEKVLAVYEALRPYRVRYEHLLALADELERDYHASENARLIREAAAAYRQRGLL